MRLTHRQIEMFRAVMASGQVTQAALALRTSQPTVSRELARLEHLLGMALFERVKGRLRPTVRALALMAEVERSYVGLDRIAATALALRSFAQGRLAVACLPALAQALLPEALRGFLTRQPEAGVTLSLLESPALEAAMTDQRFDVALTERRDAPVACTLRTLLVADEVCVLPPGHALAAKARLEPPDFEGQAFISLAGDDPYRQQIDNVFAQAGVQRRMQLETPSAVSVCALVRQGLGAAIVNPVTALALADTGLVIRPFAVAIPFHVAVVLPEWRAQHPLRADLLAALDEAASGLLAALAGRVGRVNPAA